MRWEPWEMLGGCAEHATAAGDHGSWSITSSLISPRAGIFSALKSSNTRLLPALTWCSLAEHNIIPTAGWYLGGLFCPIFRKCQYGLGTFFRVREGKGQPEQISQPELKTERGKTVC